MSQERTELPHESWRAFFENLSSQYRGYGVTIESVSHEYGDQLEAEDLPLASLEYDPTKDMLVVTVDGRHGSDRAVLRHMIAHPLRILADEISDDVPWAIEVFAKDDAQTIVALHRRPGLPPPNE